MKIYSLLIIILAVTACSNRKNESGDLWNSSPEFQATFTVAMELKNNIRTEINIQQIAGKFNSVKYLSNSEGVSAQLFDGETTPVVVYAKLNQQKTHSIGEVHTYEVDVAKQNENKSFTIIYAYAVEVSRVGADDYKAKVLGGNANSLGKMADIRMER